MSCVVLSRHWPEDIPLTSTTGTTIYMAPGVNHPL